MLDSNLFNNIKNITNKKEREINTQNNNQFMSPLLNCNNLRSDNINSVYNTKLKNTLPNEIIQWIINNKSIKLFSER